MFYQALFDRKLCVFLSQRSHAENIVIQCSKRVSIRNLEVQSLLLIELDELLNHIRRDLAVAQVREQIFHFVDGEEPRIGFVDFVFGEAALGTSACEPP